MIPDTTTNQKDRLAKRLIELRPDISSKDRSAYCSKHKMNRVTLSRYLNGYVERMNLDVAVGMIKYFEGRIAHREIVILKPAM